MATQTQLKAEALLEEYGSRDHLVDFILGTGYFHTKDEHDLQVKQKPLPDKPYTRAYLDELAHHQYVIVPKSRQMVVTWLTMAYLVARLLTGSNLLIIVQTKKEEDAFSLVDRAKFIYDHLPAWIRTARKRVPSPLDSKGELSLPGTYSKLWGIPQGADVIRSNTVSIYYGDELDFQPESRASIRAVMPSVIGGGQFIGTSTVELGGVMESLVNGKEEE
jgi:hypothetical protein